MDPTAILRRIRLLLLAFILALVVSGLTAIPLRLELSVLDALSGQGTAVEVIWPALAEWISKVHVALEELHADYAFLAYGYDWLAFGHFVIAIAFVGAYRQPVRNEWLVEFGLIACALVLPYALLLGEVRGIPLFWRFIDGLFGIVGFAILWTVRRDLERLKVSGAARA